MDLSKVKRLLAAFREVDPEMAFTTGEVLMVIAGEPGISLKVIAQKLGLTQATVSRHVAILSGRREDTKRKSEGYGFVTLRADPLDGRARCAFLSPEGQAFVRKLSDIVTQ